MTIETYPTTPVPAYSYVMDTQFRTLVSDMESGEEQRRVMWRFPKRLFTLIYKTQDFSSTGRDALYEFFHNRRGMGDTFWFFDFKQRKIIDEYVGYGDGVTTTFDLHSKTTTTGSTLKIYVDSVLQTVTTHYVFVSGGGSGGADRITFQAGFIPTEGQLITSDFNGYLRILGRFKEDKLSEDIFTANYANIQVVIFEVKS